MTKKVIGQMSKPVIARDLQRIVAFIPFHSDRLDEVIDRAWWWADEIFVRDYPESKVDAMVFGDPYAHEIDLDSIEEAWLECEQKTASSGSPPAVPPTRRPPSSTTRRPGSTGSRRAARGLDDGQTRSWTH